MKRLLLLVFGCLIAHTISAQITGPTSVTVGQSASYLVYEDIVYTPFTFTVVNGTVTASSRSGTNYNVTITWNLAGTGSIKFDQDGQTLSVAVTGPCSYTTPATPAPTFSVSTACGTSKTISYTGTAPTGYAWYWQTSATGTSTTNSSTSYTVTTSGTYYLRARSTCNSDYWSTSAATPAVTITPVPAVPTAVTNINPCPMSSFTLAGTVGANGNTLKWYWASTGGTSIAQGTTVTYNDIDGDLPITTTFYASSYNTTTGCESTTRKPLTATMKATPSMPTTTGGSTCQNGTVTLTGTVGTGATLNWYGASWFSSPGTPLLATGLSYTTPALATTTTYYARRRDNTTGCESSPVAAIATVQTMPTASATTQNIFTGQSISIPISNPNNVSGTTFSWTAAATNVSGASNGSGNLIAQTLSTTTSSTGTVAYTITPAVGGCIGTPIVITPQVFPIPIITPPQAYVTKTANVTLDAGAGYNTYAWTDSATNTTMATTQTVSTNVLRTYILVVTKSGATSAPLYYKVRSQLYGMALNYIISNDAVVSGITDPTSLNNLPVDQVNQSIAYFDGIGRPIQTVATQASPLKQDVFSPTVYDPFGREYRKYLPAVAGSDGRYKDNVIDASGNYAGVALNFYNNGTADKIPDDTRPFSETQFELSPLERPSANYGAGDGWNNKNITPTPSVIIDKPSLHGYEVNNASTESIIAWMIDPVSGLPIHSPSKGVAILNGYYASGQLSIKSTKDEQGHEVREYTDKSGHVILKKVQIAENAVLNDATGTQWALTYYIYDKMNRLALVLSPEAVNAIK